MEELIQSLKEYVLSQYIKIVKSKDYGEAGLSRIKSDFYRYYKKIPAAQMLSLSELDKFDKEINWGLSQKDYFVYDKVKFKTNETGLLNEVLEKNGYKERLFLGAKKEGFPILLFGPAEKQLKDGREVFIIKKELVRSPAAVLPMIALTNSSQQLIIRQEAIEYIFWKKWVQGSGDRRVYSAYGVKNSSSLLKIKDLFISEMLETTIIHELCHTEMSNQENVILSKLLSATTPNYPLDALDELLVEWFPHEGVIPYIANLSKTNLKKAKRLFFRYLAEGDKSLVSTLVPYVKGEEINFSALISEAESVFEKLLKTFNNYLDTIKGQIESAEFSYNGMTVSYSDLVKTQHRRFKEQSMETNSDLSIYKRYFWANMLNYVKNCSKETYDKLLGHLNPASISIPLD